MNSELLGRERSHRRMTLVAITGLLLLSTSPVFAHHFTLGLDSYLAGLDHLGALCITALHLLFAPVHRVFHLLLVGGVAYAIWDRYRAWRKLRSSLDSLAWQSPSPGDAFWEASANSGINPRLVRVVDGFPMPAATAGWWRPTVYVSADLGNRLSAEQLAAVLAHEKVHLDRRDPLRLSILRFLAVTLFWIPAIRRLSDDLADEAEILADDHAGFGRRLVLASALLALAGERNRGVLAGMVGLHSGDLLERRVRRLAGENIEARSHVTRRSLAGAAFALSAVWSSGVLVAHPMPTDASGHVMAHCEHEGQLPFSHVFCLGFPLASHRDCPHQGP